MPELPEVENVRLTLEQMDLVGQQFARVELRREGLRRPFPKDLAHRLAGQPLVAIRRRAKYLLFETKTDVLLSHLGMTGSWRLHDQTALTKHDHVVLGFSSGQQLVFHDPRRFGVLDLTPKNTLAENLWLQHLGPEPLGVEFTGDYIFTRTRKRTAPIKAWLMDQRQVVGVGNIYASEALHRAQVRPRRAAGRINRAEAQMLALAVREILAAAISAGGSTIRDYRNSYGESGSYQQRFFVYGRGGEQCRSCNKIIQSAVVAGRSTFWCGQCQR